MEKGKKMEEVIWKGYTPKHLPSYLSPITSKRENGRGKMANGLVMRLNISHLTCYLLHLKGKMEEVIWKGYTPKHLPSYLSPLTFKM